MNQVLHRGYRNNIFTILIISSVSTWIREIYWFEHGKYSEGQIVDFTCKIKGLCTLKYSLEDDLKGSLVLQTAAFQEELEHCNCFLFFFFA